MAGLAGDADVMAFMLLVNKIVVVGNTALIALGAFAYAGKVYFGFHPGPGGNRPSSISPLSSSRVFCCGAMHFGWLPPIHVAVQGRCVRIRMTRPIVGATSKWGTAAPPPGD